MHAHLRTSASHGTATRPGAVRSCLRVTCSSLLAPSSITQRKEKASLPSAGRDDFASVLGLVQWAIANKIKFTGVRPDIRDGIRGVYATSDIGKGETMVAVPMSASLTVQPGERSPFPEFVPQDAWRLLPWYAQLALRLLHERARGPASRFADYLPALPGEPVDLPAAWPPGEVAALQYHHLQQQILEEQEEWARICSTLRPYLERRSLDERDLRWALTVVRSRTFAAPYFPTPPAVKLAAGAAAAAAVAAAQAALGPLDPSGDGGVGLATLEALLPVAAAALTVPAAWQAAESRRAESGEPGTVMYSVCPFIDMFNHDSRSQTECVFAPWRREFRVVAGQPAPRGAQLLINYGSQSNDSLLQRYGFVQLEGNPCDRYVMQDLLGPLAVALREQNPAAWAGAAPGAAAATGILQQAAPAVVTRAELAEAAQRSGAAVEALGQVPITSAGFPQRTVQAVASLLTELSRSHRRGGGGGGGGSDT